MKKQQLRVVLRGDPEDSRGNSEDTQSDKEGDGETVEKPIVANAELSLGNAVRPQPQGNNSQQNGDLLG